MPFVPLYAGVVAAKGWLFDHGVLKQRRLGHPVISIGSLSAGGAGKTPVVLMLAELLAQRRFEVRILTRGYGRAGTAIERVDADGDAAQFGDEPLLMARRLPEASVWVGADRYQAGVLAERGDTAGTKAVYLLDDGFQHRKLARDADILLITQRDFEDVLLPAGNLREPLAAIKRAQTVVLREDESDLAKRIASEIPEAARRVWVVQRRLRFVTDVPTPARPALFCGLARSDGFVAMLKTEGSVAAATVIFRDHHAYSPDDIERLVKTAKLHRADGFVTTEKDAVKLTPAMIERLRTVGPVLVPRLEVALQDESACIEELLSLMAEKTAASA